MKNVVGTWLSIVHLEKELTGLNIEKQSKQLNKYFLITEFKKLCQLTKDYRIW